MMASKRYINFLSRIIRYSIEDYFTSKSQALADIVTKAVLDKIRGFHFVKLEENRLQG